MYQFKIEGTNPKVQDFLESKKTRSILETIPVFIVPKKDKDPFEVRMQDKWFMKNMDLDEGFKKIYDEPVTSQDFLDAIVESHREFLHINVEVKELFDKVITDRVFLKEIVDNLSDVGNYYQVQVNDGQVPILSYVPSIKYNRFLATWPTELRINRNATSVIKFALRRIGKELSDKEVEEIANLMKAYYMSNELEVIEVSGKDIAQYYYAGSNARGKDLGDLANSCMRYAECQTFFGIYTDNPKTVSMLVARYRGKGIVGRTLVWNLTDGTRARDRIYGSAATQKIIMKYCDDNNILSRDYLSSRTSFAHIENSDFNKYPYIDTLCYFDPVSKCLMSERAATDYGIIENAGWRYHKVANGGYSHV